MSRYIDAELAKETIREYLKTVAPMPRICEKVMDIAIGAVDLTPTADVVEVRHAYWEYIKEADFFICSNCKASALNNYRGLSVNSNYCPECGAKMDGEGRATK